MKTTMQECLNIAMETLRPTDIPAVVFVDVESSCLIAEAAARFAMRPDVKSGRYLVLLRVCEDLFLAAHYLDVPPTASPVIDIYP